MTTGVELAVLPELFNTGYSLCPDYGPLQRDGRRPDAHAPPPAQPAVADGDRRGIRRARRAGTSTIRSPSARPTATSRSTASATWSSGSGSGSIPADRPLVVSTPWGRVGFAICADMIYRKVWNDYRDRIDLAVVSAAWPDFADRDSGRRHWLLGHVGPLSEAIPAKVATDLGIPVVFANQCGETHTTIPVLGTRIKRPVRRPEQHLRRPARRRRCVPATSRRSWSLPSPSTSSEGLKSWRSTSPSAPAASSSGSALS